MCIFCQIANKLAPAKIIKESDDFIAFLDLVQSSKGKTLIIPKKHVTSFLEADSNLSAQMIYFAKEVTMLLQEKLDVTSFNLFTNAGSAAGQTVNHYHLHIQPRYDQVELDLSEKVASAAQLEAIYQKIIS